MSNTSMEHPLDIERRLTNLEIKASFQEDLLEELNQTVFRQQQQLDSLLRDVLQLRLQAPGAETGISRGARDELPPHY